MWRTTFARYKKHDVRAAWNYSGEICAKIKIINNNSTRGSRRSKKNKITYNIEIKPAVVVEI